MGKRRQGSPIVEHDGKFYVKTRAIMDPMVVLFDGLPVVTFKGDKNWYLPFDDALAWSEKEARSGEPYDVKRLEDMRNIKKAIEEGRVRLNG